jgi:HAD superfamily hydrolase (TIGR01484 family)
MLLATDLDGTFLGGKSPYKQQLYQLIRENKDIRLVFVTGRSLETVIPLLNDPIIPNPDFIICDVGATIVNGHTLEPIEPLQGAIEKKWPGTLKILEQLKDITGLRYQEVPQERRCSFYTDQEDIAAKAKLKVNGLGCDVIYSSNKFLDVLTEGVNKGSSLAKLVNYLCIDHEDVLVAGDTLNDLAMYECGFKGVVVGNAEEKLITATKNIDDVYLSEFEGTGGILMGLKHFGFMSRFIKNENYLRNNENVHTPRLIVM